MIRFWIWVCFFILFIPQGLIASETDKSTLKKVVNALESPFRGEADSLPAISDFSFTFIQDSEVASLNQHQQARGEAQFKFLPASEKKRVSPLFRWEYSEPDKQLIVSDGREIWFYVPDNQQAIRSEAKEALSPEKGNNPLLFLTNLGELSRFFEIRWFGAQPEKAEEYFLELIPLGKSPLIKTIVLSIPQTTLLPNKKDQPMFPISSLLLTNVNNDRTHIRITEAQVNQKPEDNVFRFSPPPGTEILTPEDVQQAF
ncbi:MAG: outer membrane lipoprotein carrier protein LolA [Deltaproteobacteria bacterium]|nr:outer membrane lipoprotein carrier protein LolA [Deltaproteobacteria bacterium]